MNNISLVGRLTNDPELKGTTSGHSVVRFQIAVDRPFASADGERKADFIPITAWRGTAEFIDKYFSKGQRIGITGRVETNSYKDDSGNWVNLWSVVADNVEFVESKGGSTGGQSASRPTERKETARPDDSDLQLPFDI